MARKIPVIICTIRQSPSREPKFHHEDRFGGAGRSIRELFRILRSG